MNIRSTVATDIPFVLGAERHADNAPYITQNTPSWHKQAIKSEDYAHIIAEAANNALSDQASTTPPIDPKPIGYLILAGIQNPHLALEIRRLVVIQKGQGYGRQILRWTKDFAFKQLGYHRLWLDVLERNYRAKALYESEGFVFEGIIRDGFKSAAGYESMVLMSILENEYLGSTLAQ